MLHALKTVQPFFDDIIHQKKKFEVRKDDRPFEQGDDIVLQEWDSEGKRYTGYEWRGKISYIMRDAEFCKKGYCIFGIEPIEPPKTKE